MSELPVRDDVDGDKGPGEPRSPKASISIQLESRVDCGNRLQALHPDVLRRILLLCGRPTRAVCRRFRNAYGPSTAVLLPDDAACRHLIHLAAAPPGPLFPHAHTLACTPPPAFPLALALIAALPAAFPSLRALHLTPADLRYVAHYQHWGNHSTPLLLDALPHTPFSALTPLAATLTHLSAAHLGPPALHALAAALPSLRSLHVHGLPQLWREGPQPAAQLQALAGRLPHLQALHISPATDDDALPPAPLLAAPLLARLAAHLPHLTRLAVRGLPLQAWGPAASATLASAWPRLADLELTISGTGGRLAGAGAALAQHTALTRLYLGAAAHPEWDLLATLRLRELAAGALPCWPRVAARMGTVTRLCLSGWLGAEAAGHLALMAGSLLSLTLSLLGPDWGVLARLSCLSRLQDLTLAQEEALTWSDEEEEEEEPGGITAEQAVGELAAGLSSLRYLHVQGLEQPGLEQQLVACLAGHGKLRELHLSDWHPRWPAHLAGLAGSLARLELSCGDAVALPTVLHSLVGLRQLCYLRLLVHRLTPNAHAAGGGGGGGASAAAGTAATGRLLLPPVLRVLVVEMSARGAQLLPVQLHGPQAALWEAAGRRGCEVREVAGRQGCEIRAAAVQAEWDDCAGYAEGASLAWLWRHGRL